MTKTRAGISFLMLVTFLAFISIGFPDAVLGVAWPSMRETFGRPLSNVGFILVASGTGYFLSGIIAGKAIGALGVGRLLAVSTTFVATGLFGYAITPSFWLVLVAAVLIGLGSGAVDTGLNFYAAEHFSVTVMNWLHAFFGVGAMVGPFVMVGVFAAGGTWRVGYVVVATAILAMAILFFATEKRWDGGGHHETAQSAAAVPVRHVLGLRLVWVQILIFFVMCGIEASAGTWTATIMAGKFDATRSEAGIWAGVFWGAMAFGRIVLPLLSRDLNPARLVQFGTIGVFAGALLMTRDQAWVFQGGLILFGLAMAPLFPTLMSLTPVRLGTSVSLHTIGFQVSAATVGIATIPTLGGVLAERTSLTAIPWVMTAGAAVVIALETVLRSRADRPEPVGASIESPA
ncbi:MAG TPA: MFS transporter [Thermomicrobiales bacterium]|nr:MFS transporter [Thermomicrobiales bacterium]